MTQLADHPGDVLRKARLATGVPPETLAIQLGVPPEVWSSWERDGVFPPRLDWGRVAALLGLHPERMAGLCHGWRPSPVDLESWRELRCLTSCREGLAVHAYLVWDEATREAALMDTGWDAGPVLDLIRENELNLNHLFLTHTHDDHMAAMDDLRRAHPKLKLHTNSRHAPLHCRNRPQECVPLGGLRITHRDLPGPSRDGVVYIVGNWPEDMPPVAFVGDTLFAGSLAEAHPLLREGVARQLFSLPGPTLVCPGHGPPTTVDQERAHNPFFGIAS